MKLFLIAGADVSTWSDTAIGWHIQTSCKSAYPTVDEYRVWTHNLVFGSSFLKMVAVFGCSIAQSVVAKSNSR